MWKRIACIEVLSIVILLQFCYFTKVEGACQVTLSTGTETTVNTGQQYEDQCKQRCICQADGSGRCCRVRKDILTMPRSERVKYIKTLLKIQTDPDFLHIIRVHSEQFYGPIHNSSMFLSWHRLAILLFENVLRKYDCQVTSPYFEVRTISGIPLKSKLFSDDDSWIGGTGVGPDECVQTGPFREGKFTLSSLAGGTCLKRNFTPEESFVPATQIRNVVGVSSKNFNRFRFQIDHGFHDALHGFFKGTAGLPFNPNAPEFFLIHGFADKVWVEWQMRGPKFQNSFEPGPLNNTPSDLLPGSYFNETIRDFWDTHDQGFEHVDVCYDDTYDPEALRVLNIFRNLSTSQVKQIPSVAPPPVSDFVLTFIGVAPSEQKKVKKYEKNIRQYQNLTMADLQDDFSQKFGFQKADLERVCNCKV